MKIYKYSTSLKPRPSCVEDGGYAYMDGDVLGFGTDESEYEITISEAIEHYEEWAPELDFDGEQPPTAAEFFTAWGIIAE